MGTLEELNETVPSLVQRLLAEATTLWFQAPLAPPDWLPLYSPDEQARREESLTAFLETLSAELSQRPADSRQRQATQQRLQSAFGSFARAGLGWQDRHLELLLGGDLTQVSADFAQCARRFDAKVSGQDIFQASRNVWTMNGLQILMGLPPKLTPSIFAYSMLYPYTDNYLDDSSVSSGAKLGFSQRFRERLMGKSVEPENAHEERIWRLVGMIEGEYDRVVYPQVYASLLAIHTAQEKSIYLLRPGQYGRVGAPYEADVLGISLEKGGTSVLADGYLVAGDLTQDQARFLFGYGAYLQLLDDLQDIVEDRSARQMTIYCQTAYGPWRLDSLANRTFHFGSSVMEGLTAIKGTETDALKELMRDSLLMMLVDAVGSQRRSFTRGYAQEMERHSPFRYRFLRRVRKRLSREHVSLMSMVEAFASESE